MVSRNDLQSLLKQVAPSIALDPRARATIRVGAIGHRHIDDHAQEQLIQTVKEVLGVIHQAAEDALKKKNIAEQFADGLDLVVVSPLAEGADRLIANAGRDLGFRLGAILPFGVRDYEASFDLGNRDAAIEAFRRLLDTAALPEGYGILVMDGDATEGVSRDASFLRCAVTVTRWSDILIGILSEDRWDSQTGQDIRRAIAMGIPVVVIDPRMPGRFALHADGVPRDPVAPSQRLSQLVVSLLEPSLAPGSESGKHTRPDAAFGLASYRNEHVSCDTSRACDFEYGGPYQATTAAPRWARCFSGLNRWIEKRIERLLATPTMGERAGPFLWDLPLDCAAASPILELYLRYHRADAVANAYAELQRSIQIVVALLGVGAVTFATLADQMPDFSVLFGGLELACLAFALLFVWISHRQAWLDRWLDCRLLAEIFRYSKFLLTTGLASPFGDLRGSHDMGESGRTWARDHAQDVLRAQRINVPGRGRETNAAAIGSIAEYIAEQCVEGQARYHFRTGHLRLKHGKALKNLGVIASIATLVVVVAKLGLEILIAHHTLPDGPSLETWRKAGNVAATVLPALTAGLLALRAFGEHDVIGLRSLAMARVLEREKHIVNATSGLQALGDEMLRITRMLLHDIDGWRELFSGKHLES